MVTIRDVAKAAGVSVATASRALNGMSIVTAKTREKIEAAATALDYVPHSGCLLYTSPSPRDRQKSRMPSSA